MTDDRPILLPGPGHPIAIVPEPGRVVVTVAGRIVADSRAALVLSEASYPPVHYLPRADVDMAMLERTGHRSYCPYKGEASYFSIPAGGEGSANAAWSYEDPHPAMARIAKMVAFYPGRVDGIRILEQEGPG